MDKYLKYDITLHRFVSRMRLESLIPTQVFIVFDKNFYVKNDLIRRQSRINYSVATKYARGGPRSASQLKFG